MKIWSKDGTFKPNPKYGIAAILTEVELEAYTQALKVKRWLQAISDEADAFIRNDNFYMVGQSKAKNIVGPKWIYFVSNVYLMFYW